MVRMVPVAAVATALLMASPAEARFGKRTDSDNNSSSSDEHSAEPAKESKSTSSGGTHSASSVGGEPSATTQSKNSWFYGFARPANCGFWSGAFVPWYGYGLRRYDDQVVNDQHPSLEEEDSATRLVAGIETQFFGSGFTIGAGVSVEFGSVGLSVSGANIAVRADDGTNTMDNLQQVRGTVSYAFLTGVRGRWKAEAGVDAVFAPDLVVAGPTVGTSGTVWIAGPLAAEGSAYWTFWPYDQVDLRLGATVGVGPLGMRAGWRFQLLSDRGLVDQIVHTDIFTGPYVGLGLAL